MFKISNPARKKLGEIISNTKMNSDKFLRLAVPPAWTGEGDFGIVIDSQNPDDMIIYTDADTILLLIDPSLTDNLSNSILDFKGTGPNATFALDIY
jgi:Fe-S cluster assembly iron-binding protein IscA